MTRDHAEEIAAILLSREAISSDRVSLEIDRRAVARSLEALLPELDEAWGVVEMRDLASTKIGRPMVLALEGERLWAAAISRGDDRSSHFPQVMTRPYDPPNWQIASVTDTLSAGGAGEERIRRAWHLTLAGDQLSFTTDELVFNEPTPSREEQLGRALAANRGWQVRDLSARPGPRDL